MHEWTDILFKRKIAAEWHLRSCFCLVQWNESKTLKAPPIICSRRQFQILSLFQKLQIRGIVCWQMILIKYHASFLAKTCKDVAKFVVCCSRETLCMLGNFSWFFFVVFFVNFYFQNIPSWTKSECQMVWIQIRTDFLLVLIWVQLFAKVICRRQKSPLARKELNIQKFHWYYGVDKREKRLNDFERHERNKFFNKSTCTNSQSCNATVIFFSKPAVCPAIVRFHLSKITCIPLLDTPPQN